MMPDDGIETLRGFDAILLGAVGWPGVPDHVSLWGLLIPIRRAFRQYVNLRPIKVFDGCREPAAGAGRRRLRRRAGERRGRVQRDRRPAEPRLPGRDGCPGVGFHARRGEPDRGLRVRAGALEARVTSRRRRSRTGSCTRCRSGTRWSPSGRRSIPDVRMDSEHIDALAAKFVLQPQRFDVVVGSNLFGDILSDLAAAVAGSIGIAPSANLDPTKEYPSMFEPVHGSAPDIAGQGVANPIGAVWSAALMLEHLGHDVAADEVLAAMESTLAKPETRTGDLGGTRVDGRGDGGAGRPVGLGARSFSPSHFPRGPRNHNCPTHTVCAGRGRGARLRRPFVEPRQPTCDVPPGLSPAGG